jgi:glutathione S-transferase
VPVSTTRGFTGGIRHDSLRLFTLTFRAQDAGVCGGERDRARASADRKGSRAAERRIPRRKPVAQDARASRRRLYLADSSAIIQFLEAKLPDPALIPAEPRLRGKTIWFEEFADTVACAAVGKIFFNRVVAPRFLGREGDLEAAAACERDDLPPMLDYLEKVVPADDGFLVGDTLTLADIAVASPFANFQHCNVNVDPDRYPRTLAYVQRILARPSFSQWVERERAFLTKEAA